MPTLILLRHGTLLPNPERRFVGQRDIPLGTEGRRQALFWQKELAHEPFREVWSSDLPRCRETASLIVGRRPLAVDTDPAFREIHLGDWEGLTKKEVEERFPGALDARGRDLWNYVPCGGESFAMLACRVLAALQRRLLSLPQGGTALLVAHSAVNRIILMQYLALGVEDVFALPQPYAACTTLYYSREDLLLLSPRCLPPSP